MRKKIWDFAVSLTTVALVMTSAACSSPPTPPPSVEQQAVHIAELEARGFTSPVYIGRGPGYRNDEPQYAAYAGGCRITLSVHENSWAWVLRQGSSARHTFVVRGDDRLNAEWLKANPTGPESGWDLTACIDADPVVASSAPNPATSS